MKIVCVPAGIVDSDRPGQGTGDLEQAGFENVLLDLAMHRSSEELHYYADLMLEQCQRAGLGITAASAPYLEGEVRDTDTGRLLDRLVRESIGLCNKAGCRELIIRPLQTGTSGETAWKINREFYLRFAEEAGKNNIILLLQNQCRMINGHAVRGICADAAEAVSWVDRLNEEAGEERFGFCMDVGAYHLCGQGMREAAVVLGNRVKAVIVRDCDLLKENAMLPFTGVGQGQSKTDWLGLIRGLREIGFGGQLIMDFRDTASAFSPMLRPPLLSLAKHIGEYFRWQIELEQMLKKYNSIVLFGAGNMCRNYMKCYGEKYPPMFTCDNNTLLWGTKFCGLEVKPPSALTELDEKCAVVICNIYYREIEKQLREMGIRNPVEFFSDEYMPSFPFDRLPQGNGAGLKERADIREEDKR